MFKYKFPLNTVRVFTFRRFEFKLLLFYFNYLKSIYDKGPVPDEEETKNFLMIRYSLRNFQIIVVEF